MKLLLQIESQSTINLKINLVPNNKKTKKIFVIIECKNKWKNEVFLTEFRAINHPLIVIQWR